MELITESLGTVTLLATTTEENKIIASFVPCLKPNITTEQINNRLIDIKSEIAQSLQENYPVNSRTIQEYNALVPLTY